MANQFSDFLVNAIMSEFIGGIGMDKLSRNISALLPSLYTNSKFMQSSSNNSYTMVLSDLITIASKVLTIGVYEGSKFMGNLSATSSTGVLGGNTTFSGILNQSGLATETGNLSMKIFGISIKF